MPKEKVNNGLDEQPFEIIVGWNKDSDIQIGIQLAPSKSSDEPDTLLKKLYGPNEGALRSIGTQLRIRLHDELGIDLDLSPEQNLYLGSLVLDAIEGGDYAIPYRSIWCVW